MTSIEDELFEIENYIKTLEINDETNKEVNKMIADGVSKGLIYDFIHTHYRGTMISSKVIKQEEYNEFQNYINRCEREQNEKFIKWRNEMIESGVEYSKDELKYNKLI
jgi:hypothetical protein